MVSGLPPFRGANDYQIFQKIIKVDYRFPQGFNTVAADLVSKLILLAPSGRLGSAEKGGVPHLKQHPFFDGVDWSTLHEREPPALKPYLPAAGGEPAFHSDYHVPDDLAPGLDDAAMTRMMMGDEFDLSSAQQITLEGEDASLEERKRKVKEQRQSNPYHRFVEDHLILKSGSLDKKKGLFARKRMFLLTEGPHLYYVDAANMEYKGQVPFSKNMRCEAKNFRTFFIHTPNRTYYLYDPESRAKGWCDAIEHVREKYLCGGELNLHRNTANSATSDDSTGTVVSRPSSRGSRKSSSKR